MKWLTITREEDLPPWAQREELARFFAETMGPWADSLEDVQRAFDYLFSDDGGRGGFFELLGIEPGDVEGEDDAKGEVELGGALCMLETGMDGYVPAHILLFVSVDPSLRGKGLGGEIVQRAVDKCPGAVKLHVEYDNPAKRLYERLGFTSKYAEMRYEKPTTDS